MSKQKLLLNVIIGLLAIAGVVGGVFAVRQAAQYLTRAQIISGQPQNLSVTETTTDQATVAWTTTDEVLSLLQYGTHPAQLTQTQSELSSTTTHRMTLNQLEPGTKYYYRIQVGEEVFDQDGQAYTFTTDDAQKTFSEEEFKDNYGTTDPEYDINGDGIVNSHDYSLYLQQQTSE